MSKKSVRYIRKRTLKNGETRYLVQVLTGRDAAGKPQFVHKTFDDRGDAEAYAHQVLADRQRGTVLPTAGRVGELLDDMLREQEIRGRKNLKGSRQVVQNHLRPYFGKLRIDRVTSDSIAKYVLVLSSGAWTITQMSSEATRGI